MTNVSPGLISLQEKVNLLRRLVDQAVTEAAAHDEFLNSRQRTVAVSITLHGARNAVLSRVTFSSAGEMEDVFNAVMTILNGRVSKRYEEVKRVKDEI